MATNQLNHQTIKILSIVEATTINAVAKNVLEFHRAARELTDQKSDVPQIKGGVVIFERNRENNQSANEFVNAARTLDLEVEVIPERRRFDLATISALRQTVEQQRPDIVITHSVKSHFLLWRSRVWCEFPWVAFHHGYTSTDLKMRIYNRADRWSLPHAARLITVCHAFARDLAQKTGVPVKQIAVQHNSVRPAPPPQIREVELLRKRLGITDGVRMILTVGRLSREKAHIDLLLAFKHLLETNPALSAKLIIVGDGPERARLEAAVLKHGLAQDVFFAGQISDVQLYCSAADVFVLPSHSEGSPNVVLEAMAAKLPIAATAVGGVPEILQNNETAVLVAVNDPVAMAEGIARLLSDTNLAKRLAHNAAAVVASRYTPENYVRSLMEIYGEVIFNRLTRSKFE